MDRLAGVRPASLARRIPIVGEHVALCGHPKHADDQYVSTGRVIAVRCACREAGGQCVRDGVR